MDRITQEAYYRQRVLKYAAKHGVHFCCNCKIVLENVEKKIIM